MSVFVIGGTGFIGHRLVRLLVARGHAVTCMDINPSAHSFADLGQSHLRAWGRYAIRRADGSNVGGESRTGGQPLLLHRQRLRPTCGDEAEHSRHGQLLRGRAPAGRQTHHVCQLARGERQAGQLRQSPVTEDDRVNGEYQYAKHKIVNEWQAQDFTEKFGMLITGIRPPTSPGRTRCAARSIT